MSVELLTNTILPHRCHLGVLPAFAFAVFDGLQAAVPEMLDLHGRVYGCADLRKGRIYVLLQGDWCKLYVCVYVRVGVHTYIHTHTRTTDTH